MFCTEVLLFIDPDKEIILRKLLIIFLPIKVVGDSCQKITLLLLERKSVRVIVPESCF